MPFGQNTYEGYLRKYKRSKGHTRGAMPREAWTTYNQNIRGLTGKSEIDTAMGKIGLTPGPLTQRIRGRQKSVNELTQFLNRLRGMGR